METPKGSFFKRSDKGRIDFISPFPCPFNYGSVLGTLAEDGEGVDAVMLGPSLAIASEATYRVQAVVAFIDKGQQDHKIVLSGTTLTTLERYKILLFFRVYARVKAIKAKLEGKKGNTQCLGWISRENT